MPVQTSLKGPKPGISGQMHLMLNDLSEHISPGNTTSGPDTSQSALISNRSNKPQQVKHSANVAHPSSTLAASSAQVLSPSDSHKQCLFTHQELEEMGKSQSQQDLEERRIRVFTGSSSGSKQSTDRQPHKRSNKHRSNRKSLTHPEIIQEAECEEED